MYRGWDSQLEREVAVKLLPRAPAGAGSPLAEARNLARIRHANVVTVYGADQDDDHVGIWMEFIEGQTLAAMVRDRGPMSAHEVTGIGGDLCHALSALHAAGLLHRDIKPHNVMRETGGRVVLMDFSGAQALAPIARRRCSPARRCSWRRSCSTAATPSLRRTSTVSACSCSSCSPASVPVEGRTIAALKTAHAQGRRKRLRDLPADLPDAIGHVIERATDPDPAGRYQTAGELERALAGASGSHARVPSEEAHTAGTLRLFGASGWKGGLLLAATLLLGAVGAAASSAGLRRGPCGRGAISRSVRPTPPAAGPESHRTAAF